MGIVEADSSGIARRRKRLRIDGRTGRAVLGDHRARDIGNRDRAGIHMAARRLALAEGNNTRRRPRAADQNGRTRIVDADTGRRAREGQTFGNDAVRIGAGRIDASGDTQIEIVDQYRIGIAACGQSGNRFGNPDDARRHVAGRQHGAAIADTDRAAIAAADRHAESQNAG